MASFSLRTNSTISAKRRRAYQMAAAENRHSAIHRVNDVVGIRWTDPRNHRGQDRSTSPRGFATEYPLSLRQGIRAKAKGKAARPISSMTRSQ